MFKQKIKITESQFKTIILNEMAYPSSFNMENFKQLTSFNKRIAYCREHLNVIGSGSSRIVFKIDDEKVLKLAKNKKGLAQNEVEADGGLPNYGITPTIYDEDENYLWIEMGLVEPVNDNDFKAMVGYDFKTICLAFQQFNPSRNFDRKYIPDEVYEQMWDNQWMINFFTYIGDFQPPIGDLLRIEHYGKALINGKETIVLIDAGLSDDVLEMYF